MQYKIGLYFGSFNPIHTGHLIIAQTFLNETDLQEIWFVVSPQNPLKSFDLLADEKNRAAMVSLAVDGNPQIKCCNVEFTMPKPSYTIHTLDKLKSEYPIYEFCIIMGADNLSSLHLWKDYRRIVDEYSIYVYPRAGYDQVKEFSDKIMETKNFPYLDISSTYIRSQLKEGKSIRYIVPDKVLQYIEKNNLYK